MLSSHVKCQTIHLLHSSNSLGTLKIRNSEIDTGKSEGIQATMYQKSMFNMYITWTPKCIHTDYLFDLKKNLLLN